MNTALPTQYKDVALVSAEQLSGFYDALSSGVVLVDSKETIVFWNAWVSLWTGIQRDDAVGKPLSALFPRLIASEFFSMIASTFTTGDGFSWNYQQHPEKLDDIEQAMTRGDRKMPLQQVNCKPAALEDLPGLVLVELQEMPYSQTKSTVETIKSRTENTTQGHLTARFSSDYYGIIALDRFGFIQQLNEVMVKLSGFDASTLIDKPIRILFPHLEEPSNQEGYRHTIETAIGRNNDGHLELITAEGEPLKLEVHLFDDVTGKGELRLLCRDVTRSSGASEALLRQREQLSAIYSNVADAILMVDSHGRLENSNAAAVELLSLGNRRSDQASVEEVLRLQDGEGNWLQPFAQVMSRERTVSLMETNLVVAGNPVVPVAVTATPIRDTSNRISGCLIVIRAVSESRRVSTRLSWHETHDPLTQLANRREIENEIVRAIDASHVENISHLLLYVDLYNFSVVNDTCGHAAGDELLRQFARLMRQEVQDEDVVARIGNDEFAILLWNREPGDAQEEAEAVLKRITAFSLPWGERRLKVGASIGVQPISRESASEIDIMLSASAACAAAKEAGRNRIHYQHAGQDNVGRHSLSKWTTRVSEALEENRFVVYCQPIVPIKGQSEKSHYEALVRMLDLEGNIVPPGKFIPAAEASGLIDDIDRWVFDKVFDTMAAQPADKQKLYGFSVNLSGQTISDERFRDHVIGRFKNSSLPPEMIRFEITETAAVKHFDRALRFIRTFRELGCSFALDDFGSGLSSFGYLKQLPVDYLKIDGSFVRKMEVGDVEYSMVSTINHLAHIMGLETIAECVENQTQLSMLEEMGVDFAQGYVISKPVPMDTII